MRIDHRRAHIFVPQQLLYGSYVITIFKKMGGKAMPESMTAAGLVNLRQLNRSSYGALHTLGRYVMAALLPASGIA
jgi:hypothetical protein